MWGSAPPTPGRERAAGRVVRCLRGSTKGGFGGSQSTNVMSLKLVEEKGGCSVSLNEQADSEDGRRVVGVGAPHAGGPPVGGASSWEGRDSGGD